MSPQSESSNSSAGNQCRDSSMPNMARYNHRLRKLRDITPGKRSQAVIFTGASTAKANRRLLRLVPPSAGAVAKRDAKGANPGFFGSDGKSYEKRTQRYVEVRNAGLSRRGGAPVFSGASAKSYTTRMLRLHDRF